MNQHAQLAKRLPSWLYKAGAQMYIDRVYPRHLFIETTANCNLSCSYCPRQKISSNMDFGLFRKIIDEASGYGARSFSLHLFGEPLLYPHVFEAISYIKGRNPNHTILLTTNGTKVNECVDDLVCSGVTQVYWTWRREARFTEPTLLKLRKWGKFRVRFIDELTPHSALMEWRDWKNVEGRRLHNYGGDISLERFGGKSPEGKRYPCYHLWLAPAVSWNGNFLMCCADHSQKEIFGDINLETVSQAWNRLNTVRDSHMRGEYKGICANCDVYKEFPDIFYDFQKTKHS